MKLFRIATSSNEEEDFLVMTTLTREQIVSVLEPIVSKERANDEIIYANGDLFAELGKAYPDHLIYMPDSINFISI